MGKTAKDPVPGAVAKAEDVPDPSTVPSAPPGSGGEYEYYEQTAEYVGNRDDSGTMTGLTIFLICSSTMGKTVKDPAQGAVGNGGIRRKQRLLWVHDRSYQLRASETDKPDFRQHGKHSR